MIKKVRIAVDHGNRNMKTCSQVFTTGLTIQATVGASIWGNLIVGLVLGLILAGILARAPRPFGPQSEE